MKILVTGGAGYIGSILVPKLLGKGHEVTVLDNFMYGQTSLLDVCANPNLNIIRGDVRNKQLLKQEMPKTEVVIPLACLTGFPICEKFPREAVEINLESIKNIIRLKNPGQKIIFPTTNSGYGIGQDNIYCTEETPLKPVSLYGQTKVDAEAAVLEGGNSITLRLATAFGVSPRMRLDLLVNDFVYKAVNDRYLILFEAHFKRNFVHVQDIARAFLHCLENFDSLKGQAYNVGLSDANLSKKELCQEIQKQLPDFYFTEAPVGKDPDKRNYIVSNQKFEKTGFRTQTSLTAGVAELIKGYQIIKRNQFSNV